MIPMDSNYRADRAEERAERLEKKRQRREKERQRRERISVRVAVYQLMESRMDPESASGLGRKISSYLS